MEGHLAINVLWLVCGAFYLADHVKLAKPDKILLTEKFSGSWLPIFPIYSFQITGRTFSIINPLCCWLGVVEADWLTPDPFNSRRLLQTHRALLLHGRRLWRFRIISIVAFVSLFIVGPIATYRYGLVGAIQIVFVIHVCAILYLLLFLVLQRHQLFVAEGRALRILGVVAECLICPGYLANINKRVSLLAGPTTGDGIAYALSRGDALVLNSISRFIEDFLEYESARASPKHPESIREYQECISQKMSHQRMA